MSEDEQASLTGLWFHSFAPDRSDGLLPPVQWQGRVVGPADGGWYLVQLYSWADGRPTNMCLVDLADMARWNFYEDNESMVFNYDHGGLCHRTERVIRADSSAVSS